jgi:serine/threonine-protein kinase
MHEIEITGHIASGGNGEIYRGYLCNRQTECIVKKAGNKRASFMQLKNETNILKYLTEEGYVEAPAFYGEKDGSLVMSVIPGKTLDRIEIERLSERDLKKLFVYMASLVIKLHGLNPPVIHRDIKPSNIMIDDHGNMFLIDFGTARILEGYAGGDIKNGEVLLAGTKNYAAPEQYGGLGSESFQVDIYQLGKTMERLLKRATVSKRFENEMRAVLNKCLMPSATERYPTAAELRKDLLKIRAGKNIFLLQKFYKNILIKFPRRYRADEEICGVFIDIVRTCDTIEFL